MKASQWVDLAKQAKGWPSDYRAAKELGLTRGGMSNIRTGGSATLGDETALRVADALGEKPERVLVDQVIERTKNPEAKAAWLEIAKRMQMGFASVSLCLAIAIICVAAYAPPVRAAASSLFGDSSSLYIMLSAVARVLHRVLSLIVKICKAGRNVSRFPHSAAFLPA